MDKFGHFPRCGTGHSPHFEKAMALNSVFSLLAPVLISALCIHALIKKVDVYGALCEGAKKGLEVIKDIWGKIADAGFDTCPEIFNPKNDFESPYNAPEINSACHAWSCTPAYWIKYLDEKNND